MRTPLVGIEPFLSSIAKQCPIVTSNQRLVKEFHYAYALATAKSQQAWHTPIILSLDVWITKLWQTLSLKSPQQFGEYVLLTPLKEQLIWEKIISASSYGQVSINAAKHALQAKNARNSLILWNINPDAEDFDISIETQTFKNWLTAFNQYLQQHCCLCLVDTISFLIQAFGQAELPLYPEVILVGFDDITPLHYALLSSSTKNIKQAPLETKSSNVHRVSYLDFQEELTAAAKWSKKTHQQNSKAQIGIIIPNLASIYHLVERIFLNEFTNNTCLSPHINEANMIDIGGGVSLFNAPIIQLIFQLLIVNQIEMPVLNFCLLLRSRLFLRPELQSLCVWLETQLRKTRNPSFSLRTFLYFLEKSREHYDDVLVDQLKSPFQIIANIQTKHQVTKSYKKQLPSVWAAIFYDELLAFDFLSSNQLTHNESIYIEKWFDALNQLAEFDYLIGKVGFNKTHQLFKKILQQVRINSKSQLKVVHVLSPLDAGFLQFDFAWIIGSSDHNWPSPVEINPFIPYQLQKSLNMPHATQERQFSYAQSQMNHLLNCANTVVTSHPNLIQNQSANPCIFIKNIPGISPHELGILTEITEIPLESEQLEHVLFDDVEKISINELNALSLNATLFRNLAACNIRSLAIHRLNAISLVQPKLFLDAIDRGIIMHSCLEKIWHVIGDSTYLHQLDEDNLAGIVRQSINVSLANFQRKYPFLLGERFMKLESDRLQQLLINWLAIEKERNPFKVMHIEALIHVEFAGLPLRLRIDRIDEVNDNQWIVIDYKSSKSSISNWFGDRPNEPQLPLYAAALDANVFAILFAQVIQKDLKFIGITGDHSFGFEKTMSVEHLSNYTDEKNWDDLLNQFKVFLTDLVVDWKQGRVNINPKNSITCQHCHLMQFCRIHELHHESS